MFTNRVDFGRQGEKTIFVDIAVELRLENDVNLVFFLMGRRETSSGDRERRESNVSRARLAVVMSVMRMPATRVQA